MMSKALSAKLKLILQMAAVLGCVSVAGVWLYRDLDPRLASVPFQAVNATTDTTTEDFSPAAADLTTDLTALTETVAGENGAATAPAQQTATTTPESETPTAIDSVTTAETRSDIRAATTSPAITVRASGPKTDLTCPVTATTSLTVHQVMQQASTLCGFSYTGENYSGLGFFVEQIGSTASDPAAGYYWIYSVNGVKATLGVSQQSVKPGDTITWVYEVEY